MSLNDAEVWRLAVDISQAMEAIKTYEGAHTKAMRSAAGATTAASKEVEGAFAKKVKAVTSLDQHMAGLVARFFGVGGLIMGVRALATGLADVSPQAQRTGRAFDQLTDTFINSIANADGFKRAMDSVTSAIETTTGALNVLMDLGRNKVMGELGIIETLFVYGDIALTGGANLPDEFYAAYNQGAVARPKPLAKRSEAGARRKSAEDARRKRMGGQSLNDMLEGYGLGASQEKTVAEMLKESGVSSIDEDLATMDANYEKYLAVYEKYVNGRMKLDEDKAAYQKELQDREDAYLKEADKKWLESLKTRQAAQEEFASTMGGIAGGMTSTLLQAAQQLAQGQQVQIDKMVADFLVGQGSQLVAQGAASIVSGGIDLAFLNPQGAAKIAAGGVALGIGGLMLAGGLPLTVSAYQGGGAAAASPGLGAGRGVGGPSQGPAAPTHQSDNITVNLYGKPNADFGRLVVESIEQERRRQRA